MDISNIALPWTRTYRNARSLSDWSPHNVLAVSAGMHVLLATTNGGAGATTTTTSLARMRVAGRISSDASSSSDASESSAGGKSQAMTPVALRWHPRLAPHSFPALAALAVLYCDGSVAVFHVSCAADVAWRRVAMFKPRDATPTTTTTAKRKTKTSKTKSKKGDGADEDRRRHPTRQHGRDDDDVCGDGDGAADPAIAAWPVFSAVEWVAGAGGGWGRLALFGAGVVCYAEVAIPTSEGDENDDSGGGGGGGGGTEDCAATGKTERKAQKKAEKKKKMALKKEERRKAKGQSQKSDTVQTASEAPAPPAAAEDSVAAVHVTFLGSHSTRGSCLLPVAASTVLVGVPRIGNATCCAVLCGRTNVVTLFVETHAVATTTTSGDTDNNNNIGGCRRRLLSVALQIDCGLYLPSVSEIALAVVPPQLAAASAADGTNIVSNACASIVLCAVGPGACCAFNIAAVAAVAGAGRPVADRHSPTTWRVVGVHRHAPRQMLSNAVCAALGAPCHMPLDLSSVVAVGPVVVAYAAAATSRPAMRFLALGMTDAVQIDVPLLLRPTPAPPASLDGSSAPPPAPGAAAAAAAAATTALRPPSADADLAVRSVWSCAMDTASEHGLGGLAYVLLLGASVHPSGRFAAIAVRGNLGASASHNESYLYVLPCDFEVIESGNNIADATPPSSLRIRKRCECSLLETFAACVFGGSGSSRSVVATAAGTPSSVSVATTTTMASLAAMAADRLRAALLSSHWPPPRLLCTLGVASTTGLSEPRKQANLWVGAAAAAAAAAASSSASSSATATKSDAADISIVTSAKRLLRSHRDAVRRLFSDQEALASSSVQGLMTGQCSGRPVLLAALYCASEHRHVDAASSTSSSTEEEEEARLASDLQRLVTRELLLPLCLRALRFQSRVSVARAMRWLLLFVASATSNSNDGAAVGGVVARPAFCEALIKAANLINGTAFDAASRSGSNSDERDRCPVCQANGSIGVTLDFFAEGIPCDASRHHSALIVATSFRTVRMFSSSDDNTSATTQQDDAAASGGGGGGADGEGTVAAACLLCGCADQMTMETAHPLCAVCGGLLQA